MWKIDQNDEKKLKEQELRVYVVDLVPPWFAVEHIQDRLTELESLVTTYRWVVIVKTIQKRSQPDYRTYVWKGKLEEIKADMLLNNANLLVIWNIMKPWQVYNVSEMFREDKIQVRDRVDLILKIFDRHATSTEARLQIELAAINHMWPRIFGMGMELSRQWWWTWWSGGRAGRWIWETNTERMRRHLKDQKLVIQKELLKYKKMRTLHRADRVRRDLFTVGIAWYTNAGKSALMHALTWKDILVEDKLFATLWTAVGEMKPPKDNDTTWYIWFEDDSIHPAIDSDYQPQINLKSSTSLSTVGAAAPVEQESDDASVSDTDFDSDSANEYDYTPYKKSWKILINDTIGFIRDLPPDLIEAFTSTLEDSVHAQLLLHVVDASDPKIADKLHVVDDVLHRIHAIQPRRYIFNKIDAISKQQRQQLAVDYALYNPIFVSAITGEGLNELKKYIMWMRG
jgi:GTP-binding protein HflX